MYWIKSGKEGGRNRRDDGVSSRGGDQASGCFQDILHGGAIQGGAADPGEANDPTRIDDEIPPELVDVCAGIGKSIPEKARPHVEEDGTGRPRPEAGSLHAEGSIEDSLWVKKQRIGHAGLLQPYVPPERAILEGDICHTDAEIVQGVSFTANPRRVVPAGESTQMPEKDQKQPPAARKQVGQGIFPAPVGGEGELVDVIIDGKSHIIIPCLNVGAGDHPRPRM